MQPGAEPQPRGVAGLGIQPEQTSGTDDPSCAAAAAPVTSEHVPDAWLTGFGKQQQELDDALAELERRQRRQDRIAADVDLVTWLALQGFTGRDYELFATELAKYGNSVIIAWILRGLIFAKVRERGFGGLPEAPTGSLNRDVATELAGETVAKALHYFREKVLLTRRWDPTRGASIKTFFIGQCLIQFANVYRFWHKNELFDHAVETPEQDLAAHRSIDPADLAAVRAEIDTALAAMPERTRAVMLLTAEDWTQAEIAERLGTTRKAVERALSYYREEQRTTRRKGAA